LIHTGCIIGSVPDLVLPDEPDSAQAYFEAARDVLHEAASKKAGVLDDVRSQITLGSVLLLLADVVAGDIPGTEEDEARIDDEEDEEDETEKYEGPRGAESQLGKETIKLLSAGIDHFEQSFTLAFKFPPPLASTTPSVSIGSDAEMPRLIPLTPARIMVSLATRLLDIAEDQLPRSMRKEWFLGAESALGKAESALVHGSVDTDWAVRAGIAKAKGRLQAAELTFVLPSGWEDLDDLRHLPGKQEISKGR
jgi:hypothetical protein